MRNFEIAGALAAGLILFLSDAQAVEAYDLESVPVTNPGYYLAPADLYFQVPPPSMMKGINTAGLAVSYPSANANYLDEDASDSSGSGYSGGGIAASGQESGKTRVRIVAGAENASDIPLSVIRGAFKDLDNIELVGKGEIYDLLVEVETMKIETSPIVFIVINAYKDLDGESLIFYNNFGYLGEMKLQSGMSSFADSLKTAIESEVENN